MSRRLNYRLLSVAILILGSAAVEIAREYRPSFLRPDLRLYAYVGNADDGTVSVIDLIRVGNIATIPVGPAPSGLRANPRLNQVWGVSTQGGYAFVIDTRTSQVSARIPGGHIAFRGGFLSRRQPRLCCGFGIVHAGGHRLPISAGGRARTNRTASVARARHPRRQAGAGSQSRRLHAGNLRRVDTRPSGHDQRSQSSGAGGHSAR